MSETDEIARDTVLGIDAIASFVGVSRRRAHYLATKGQLPGVFRIGKAWAMLKSVYVAEIRARATATVRSA